MAIVMVLTLIAGPCGRSSLLRLVPAIAAALQIESEPIWLAPAEACDLFFDETLTGRAEETARAVIEGAAIDFAAALEARVALLKGVEIRLFKEATARMRLTPGARALVSTMRRHGAVSA